MKKIFLSLLVLAGSFTIATAGCAYGFLTSCGGSYYVDNGPCDWSDSEILEVYDMFEFLDC